MVEGLPWEDLPFNLPSCTQRDHPWKARNAAKDMLASICQFVRRPTDVLDRSSGYTVVTICGPDQFEHCKTLGADYCYDYHHQECGHDIRRLTENSLRYAWDTIAIESSAKMCADALWTYPGGRYGTTNPTKSPRDNVESSSVVMYTMFGEPFTYGPQKFPAYPEDFEFAKMFVNLTEQLLAEVRARSPLVNGTKPLLTVK